MGALLAKKEKHDPNIENWPKYLKMDANSSMKEPIEATVEGEIPAWLTGSLYRNGCGLFKVGEEAWSHMFDGYAVLHRWTIHQGNVSYMGTILDSNVCQKALKTNRLVGAHFGGSYPDPCQSIFMKYLSYFFPTPPYVTDNTAVNVIEMGDKLFTLTESPLINEISPATLLKTNQVDMSDVVNIHIGTAHTHSEKDGTHYFYGTCIDYRKAYNIIKVPPPCNGEASFAKAEIVATVPSSRKFDIGYTHSFGMSDNYLVLLELPLAMNIFSMLTLAMTGSSVAEAMRCFADDPIRINVLEKKTGRLMPIGFEAPHGFVFHFINCFEQDDHLICDVCVADSGEIVRDLYFERLCNPNGGREPVPSIYTRFVLPLDVHVHDATKEENLVRLPNTTATATLKPGNNSRPILIITPERIEGIPPFELPRINYDFNARDYQYVYGSCLYGSDIQKIIKLDVKNKTWKEWTIGKTHNAGEPVFVLSPDAKAEDDGVVLCPIVAAVTESSSFLLVLDASSFKELARAYVPVDLIMSLTFHGNFTSKVF